MVLRDLILGGSGACLPDGGPSASNPLGGLADSLLGSSSKSQVGETHLSVCKFERLLNNSTWAAVS